MTAIYILIVVVAFLAFGLPDVIIIDNPTKSKYDHIIASRKRENGEDR